MSQEERPSKRQRLEGDSQQKVTAVPLNNHKNYLELLQRIWDWDSMQMFHYPVSDEIVPGYSKEIDDPRDLSTMKDKCQKGLQVMEDGYSSDEGFVDDVRLMVANALRFNDKETVYYKHAKQLKKLLPRLFSQYELNDAAKETTFIPSRRAIDSEKTLRREERKNKENYDQTLKDMEEDKDAELSLEELRAKYQGDAAKKKLAEVDEAEEKEAEEKARKEARTELEESEASSTDDEDEEEESSSDESSSSDDQS